MDHEEAFTALMGSCPSFGAVDAGGSYAAAFEEAGRPDPHVRLEALAHHVVDLVARRDVEEVSWLAASLERVLHEGDQEAVELAVLGLLEPLRNIVSHDDVPVAPAEVAALLGGRAGAAWTDNEALWEDAARWRRGGAGTGGGGAPDRSGLGSEDYDRVGDLRLRRYLQAHKRRMPGGELLGVADVVRYQDELLHLSPVRPAGGRSVPWAAVIGILVVAAVVVAVLR